MTKLHIYGGSKVPLCALIILLLLANIYQYQYIYNFRSTIGEDDRNLESQCEPKYSTPFDQYFTQFSQKDERFDEMPLGQKWVDYFIAYDNHFSKYRGKDVLFVEIGVQSGGSALMWRWYFGDKFRYIGIDIDESVQTLHAPWAEIIIGDSSDPNFWDRVKTQIGDRPDIILDDGGHKMSQQLSAFENAYSWVKDDGIYACEDLHTSYMSELDFGGRKYTLDEEHDDHPVQHKEKLDFFTDLVKNSVDYMHAKRFNNCGKNKICQMTKDTLQM